VFEGVKPISNANQISWITSAQEEIGTLFINKPHNGQDPLHRLTR